MAAVLHYLDDAQPGDEVKLLCCILLSALCSVQTAAGRMSVSLALEKLMQRMAWAVASQIYDLQYPRGKTVFVVGVQPCAEIVFCLVTNLPAQSVDGHPCSLHICNLATAPLPSLPRHLQDCIQKCHTEVQKYSCFSKPSSRHHTCQESNVHTIVHSQHVSDPTGVAAPTPLMFATTQVTAVQKFRIRDVKLCADEGNGRRSGRYAPRQSRRYNQQSPQYYQRHATSPHSTPRRGRAPAAHQTPRRSALQPLVASDKFLASCTYPKPVLPSVPSCLLYPVGLSMLCLPIFCIPSQPVHPDPFLLDSHSTTPCM